MQGFLWPWFLALLNLSTCSEVWCGGWDLCTAFKACIHTAGKGMLVWKPSKKSLWVLEEKCRSEIALLETCTIAEWHNGWGGKGSLQLILSNGPHPGSLLSRGSLVCTRSPNPLLQSCFVLWRCFLTWYPFTVFGGCCLFVCLFLTSFCTF